MVFRSFKSVIQPPFVFNKNTEGINVMDFANTLDEHFEFLVFIRSGNYQFEWVKN